MLLRPCFPNILWTFRTGIPIQPQPLQIQKQRVQKLRFGAGGIKVIRVWIALRALWRQLAQVANPAVVRPIRISGHSLEPAQVLNAVAYTLSIIILFVALFTLLVYIWLLNSNTIFERREPQPPTLPVKSSFQPTGHKKLQLALGVSCTFRQHRTLSG